MLGMYVHTHWSYNRPYAARTWTLDDWQRYLRGLASLGYDAVMLWPQCDVMPVHPNESDMAFLHKVRAIIRFAHDDLGMKFAIVAAANSIGNAESAQYRFEERPYFLCEEHVNPSDKAAMKTFLEGRRRQFEPLSEADTLVIIDSDPGGYPGSTTEEFIAAVRAQLSIFRRLNSRSEFRLWLWFGWRNQCRFLEALQQGETNPIHCYFENQKQAVAEELELLKDQVEEPWSVTVGLPCHIALTEHAPFAQRRLFFPYGLVEGEPTFPLTEYQPALLASRFAEFSFTAQRYPCGAMANAQTHCLQLPHTYLFAHLANGRAPVDANPAEFAERLLPDCGELLVAAWRSVGEAEPKRQRDIAAQIRSRLDRATFLEDRSGLLFGAPARFLTDLAMNLEVRAALREFADAVASSAHVQPSLAALLPILKAYQERVGFTNACGGPLRTLLIEPAASLGDADITLALRNFDDWRHPERRRVAVPVLLDALDAWCRRGS